MDDAEDPRAVRDHQRRAAGARDGVDLRLDVGAERAALLADERGDGVRGALADPPAVDVDAAHPGLGR